MITSKEIKEIAKTNEHKINNLFDRLTAYVQMEASSDLTSDLRDWKYNTITREFCKTFHLYEESVIKYFKFEREELGIRKVIYNDGYSNQICGTIYIPIDSEPENISMKKLLPRLEKQRKELHRKWKNNARKVIANYFQTHKEEFITCPLSFEHGFITKKFVLWNCRNHYDEEMQKSLGVLTNLAEESLNRNDFVPSFWNSEEQLTTDICLEDYILHISRSYPPDKTFKQDWSDIYVCFELVNSNEPDWVNALNVVKYYHESMKYNKYKEFKKDMEEAEWTFRINKEGNSEAVAFIPIIYSEYAEFICKEAKAEFGKEIQVKGICTKYSTFYHSDMTCIELIVA